MSSQTHVVGDEIGPWKLEKKLGAGAMGEVWKARGPEGVVALKIPRRASFVRHLVREGGLLEKVHHKNVAAFISCDLEGEAPWLATELVEGEPLRALCRGTISAQHATLVADQILAGLAAIHAAGVLHLDLKPENVLVTPAGVAKIVDLGVGRAASAVMAELFLSASLASRDLPLAGTLAYMSPEQRKGRPVDDRSDLFAFGVLLYELFSGKLPESGRRLSHTRAGLTPRWDVVVAKLMHPEPGQRPASADEARQLVAFTLHEKMQKPVASGGHVPRDLATFDEDAFAFESPWVAGQTIGECELIAPLGRGGFGEVWRARRGEVEVAVKLALREEANAGLKVEAEVARRVVHDGVPRVLDDRTDDEPPHVVFELISGRSLRARIHDEGQIPIEEGLETFEAMLEVVRACHASGVVHRDLKPEHFLVEGEPTPGRDRRVWLIDFGLAGLARRDGIGGSVATGETARGTFDYMAPEQRAGGQTSEATDAFALGVCLFEIVADDLPRGPQTLATLRRGLPPGIDGLAAQLMSAKPADRPTLGQALDIVRSARRSIGATPSTSAGAVDFSLLESFRALIPDVKREVLFFGAFCLVVIVGLLAIVLYSIR